MKRLVFFITFFVLIINAHAFRLPKGHGLGFSLGDPTGITYKRFTSRRKAYQVAAGYNSKSHLHLNADFVYHNPMTYKDRYTDLRDASYYFPLGGKIFYHKNRLNKDGDKLESDVSLALRAGAGVLYFVSEMDLEMFFELVPSMDVFPATDFYFDFALGARYYF